MATTGDNRVWCAHCDDGENGPDSHDFRRRNRCPACDELVCQKCHAMSTPTDCQHWSDEPVVNEEDDD